MKITIDLRRREIVEDVLAKCNMLARQLEKNPETQELAGELMTPDDEVGKPIVARALTESFGEVKRICQQYLIYGRYNDDNRLEKIDETNTSEEEAISSPATEACKYVLLTGISYRIDVSAEVPTDIKVMDDEGNILARGMEIHFSYTPVRLNEHLTLYSSQKVSVKVKYMWGDFGTYELQLDMPRRYNIGMTDTLKSNAHRMMVDYVMAAILQDQYAEKANEYAARYAGDKEQLRLALISRTNYSRSYAADWS